MLEEFIIHYAVWDRDPDGSARRILSCRLTADCKEDAREQACHLLPAVVTFHIPEHLRSLVDELEPATDIEVTVIPWAAYGNKLDAEYDRLVRDMHNLNGQESEDD